MAIIIIIVFFYNKQVKRDRVLFSSPCNLVYFGII